MSIFAHSTLFCCINLHKGHILSQKETQNNIRLDLHIIRNITQNV